MKNEFSFWGVLRPDGKLIPATFATTKIGAQLKAAGLSRKQLHLPWRKVKQHGYQLVTIKCEVVGGGQRV